MTKHLAKNEIALLVVFTAIVVVVALVFVIAPAMQNQVLERTSSVEPTEEDKAAEQQVEKDTIAYEQSIQDLVQVVPLGQTASLANIEGVTPFVYWDGAMEITVEDAQLYDSLENARAEHDLGNVHTTELQAHDYYGPDTKLLVMVITVHNIDATVREESATLFNTMTFNPYYPEASALEESGVIPWTSYWSCPLATFDGAPADAPDNKKASFELLPGETRTLTLGYWVPGNGSTGMPSCTNYEELIVRPSLSNEPGTVIFELGLSSDGSDA